MAASGCESVRLDDIREVVRLHANLVTDAAELRGDADLFDAGMDSHSSVTLMLALEERYEIEFPDHLLTREVFQSLDSIRAAVVQLAPDATA